MPGPAGGGGARRSAQLQVRLVDLAEREGGESEDLPVVYLEGEVPALDRKLETLAGQLAGLVRAALIRGDKRQAAQAPRRKQVPALAGVPLERGVGAHPRGRPVAAEEL